VRSLDFEVVVLGGGPAGCAAATLLAKRSHRVALVRPTSPPAGALAESIPPSARRILDELGFLEGVEQAGFHANLGNSVWWAGEPLRRERFEDADVGFHVDRAGLEAVLTSGTEAAGVHVLFGFTARSAEQSTNDPGPISASGSDSAWRIECESDDGERLSLGAKWIIDATGRHGFLARSEGRLPDRNTTTIALVRRFRRPGGWGPNDTGHTIVESYDEGWAWSLPLSDEVRCFTAMVDQRHTPLEGDDVGSMLDAELARTQQVGPARDGAEPEGEAWACPASLYTASHFSRPGLLLAGDAGSSIDPLSSYGVKKALSSGWLAGVSAHTALVDPDMAGEAVAFFDNRERTVYESYRRASIRFFSDAADVYGTDFWRIRAEAAEEAVRHTNEGAVRHTNAAGVDARTGTGSDVESTNEPDKEALGSANRGLSTDVPEAAVRVAFEELGSRATLAAVPGTTLRVFERSGIEGYRIVRQDHVGSEGFPAGIRYVRGVDLISLIDIAPAHAEVPDGWTAYNSIAPPVTLPDYLTALSTAFAAGFLEHGDS